MSAAIGSNDFTRSGGRGRSEVVTTSLRTTEVVTTSLRMTEVVTTSLVGGAVDATDREQDLSSDLAHLFYVAEFVWVHLVNFC